MVLAMLELLAGARVRSRVPEREDYRAAAELLRPLLGPRDLVVAAPAYADPLVREVLGDVLSFAQAAPSDMAPFETLYAVSVDGHFPSEAPEEMPVVMGVFGNVSVLRWELGPSPVTVDLVDHLGSARVELVVGESVTRCKKVSYPRFSPGGLSRGPMRPAHRFDCDPRRPHLYVGETVVEDLHLAPRRAVYQHPPEKGFVRTTFEPQELGRSIVLYAGLYYEHERAGEHGPFEVVVRIDGAERGRMVHRDLQGWKRLVIDTADLEGHRGILSVETFARDAAYRTVSWSATLRDSGVEERGR
jgi:hypothetical protein